MKNIDFYYIITGFENACVPFTAKFTFTELANNEGEFKDSEMFFALQEQPEKICSLETYEPLEVSISRDNKNDLAHIVRVSKDKYEKTIIYGEGVVSSEN